MKLNFGLTEAQLLARRSALGGSDAPKIMKGGAAWADLWADKTGRVKPKAIMSEWDSALRHHTEELQIAWYGHKTGHKVGRCGDIVSSAETPIIRATLDGFDITDSAVLQAKHVSEWTKDPINWCIEHYACQVMHEMIAAGVDEGRLLIMHGMKEPEVVKFTLDPFQAEAYLDRCYDFWSYVLKDEPTPGAEEISMPVISYEEMKTVDFTGSNEFTDHAVDWLANKGPAKTFADAEKYLKSLVNPDVKLAFNDTIEIKRNKAGSLSIKEKK